MVKHKGVKVITERDIITIGYSNEKIPRTNKQRLQEAIEKEIELGKNPYRTPKVSPLQKTFGVN